MNNKLQKILNKSIDSQKIFGTTFCVSQRDFHWCGASGNLNNSSPFFIASTTKLFVTAILLQLKQEHKIKTDDKISNFLPEEIINGLHVLKNREYSKELTIEQLMAHTSGIPDYFQDNKKGELSLEEKLKSGQDCPWTAREAIERSKSIQPHFVPGTKGKAHYSDTNFQLLGLIIESITGKSFSQNIQERICLPLQLSDTYLYANPGDSTPAGMYYKSNVLSIPMAMSSFGPDGGIVSNANELMRFTTAFFSGGLFPLVEISSLQQWNKIFFPFQSGIGIHRFKLPWIFDPLQKIPYLIGHSGLSGTVAYYAPEKEIYVCGTVNQIAYPDLSFRIMIKLIQALN